MKLQTLEIEPGCLIVDHLWSKNNISNGISFGLVIEKIKNKIKIYWFNIKQTIEYDLIDMEWFISYYENEGWSFYCP